VIWRRIAQVGQIRLLPLPPGRLAAFAVGDAVGTALDDVGDARAERGAHDGAVLLTTILDHVMQQAGDGLILIAAIVEDECADPQEAPR
jgi:hypothetical protein